jgi:uncharacterized protein (DUF305 family)
LTGGAREFEPAHNSTQASWKNHRAARNPLAYIAEDGTMKRFAASFACCLIIAAAARAQTHEHGPADRDRMFADTMIQHHQDGIRMARIALQKAESRELRTIAQKMIDDQSRDVEQLRALRGSGLETSMDDMQMMPGMLPAEEMQHDMARLAAAQGADFDLAFTQIMATHHAGAVALSKHYLQNGENAGLREVANRIAAQQTAERQHLLAMSEDLERRQGPMTSASGERRRLAKE